ncbi:MAG: 30S ribosomal protein S5 [Candidatus Altiarchaeota archaeon]
MADEKTTTGQKAEKPVAKKADKEPVKKPSSAHPAEEKKIEAEAPEEVEADVKSEADIIPEVKGEVIVDEVADEQEFKEKILKDKKKAVAFDGEDRVVVWVPRTKLGSRVYNGEITSMHDIMLQSAPIKEVGIVDKLLPGMLEEILDVGRVQRVTDSGRRMRFRVVAAVGNGDGYVGVGEAKGKEAGPTIRKSIERAKLNIREVKRGCGSWECGCGTPHTVPFKITGEEGSVSVTLMPAPRGVGIVSGKIAKSILGLAGIKDVWVMTEGHTRTGINFAHAVLDALENTNYVKIKEGDVGRLKIVTGSAKPNEPAPKEVVE